MNPILNKIYRLLQSEDREIRSSAVRVLGELGVRDRQTVKAIGEALEKLKDPVSKELLLGIPIRLPTKEYLPYLLPYLNNFDLNREKVLQAIAGLGPCVIPALERKYPKASEQEKKAILSVISRIGHKKSLELLLKSLLDNQQVDHLKWVCSLLRNCIQQTDRSEVVWFKKFLLRFMNEPQVKKNTGVTISCLILLGYLRDPANKKAILKLLHTSTDLMVKKYTLIALSQLELSGKTGGEMVRDLIPLLDHSDYPNIVKNVLIVLEKCDFPRKLQGKLSKLLKSSHSSVRSFALSKLGSVESKENVSTLIQYLNSSDFRIRDAARNSLEKLEKAVAPILKQFEAEPALDKMDFLGSILRNHRGAFKKPLCTKLFKTMQKLQSKENERYKAYLSLLRGVNPDFLYASMMSDYAGFKRKRSWAAALHCLSFLEGTALFTNEARFELALCRIMAGKRDFSQIQRDQNQGLLTLQGLIKSNGPILHKKLLADKALKPDDIYYIGFHFSEKLFDLKEFGVKLLEALRRRAKSGKVGRLSARKLECVGTGSAILQS